MKRFPKFEVAMKVVERLNFCLVTHHPLPLPPPPPQVGQQQKDFATQ